MYGFYRLVLVRPEAPNTHALSAAGHFSFVLLLGILVPYIGQVGASKCVSLISLMLEINLSK